LVIHNCLHSYLQEWLTLILTAAVCTGCGRNSELIMKKNNILLKVIDTTFSYSPALLVD
jgi:hypothetical protein